MNSEANKLIKKRKEEFEALGSEAAYQLQALQNLRLKTVVKESHGTTVHSLAFNNVSKDCGNLFATVGGDQATIYNDEHMGDHISVAVHFTNQKTEYTDGGELQACCWVNSEGWTSHPHGEACLAVSGADPAISIISVVESRVIKLLSGHTKDVIDLSAISSIPYLLLSLSKDGNIRLWDISSEKCLSSISSDATCIALSPDASSFVIGTSRGRLFLYNIDTNGDGVISIDEKSKNEISQGQNTHIEGIDCMKFLPGDRLATKSSDGRMFVWQMPEMDCMSAWKVPGSNAMGGLSSRCAFNATPDGKYIAVGNASGGCYVFDSEDGKKITNVNAIKVSAPVRSCALSQDCRHLVAAVGKGFVFRFEYLGLLNENEEANENENENVGMDVAVDTDV